MRIAHVFPIFIFLFLGATTVAAAEADRRPIAGIAYSPAGVDFASPDPRVQVRRLVQDFRLLAPLTRRLRTYTVEQGMDQAPRIARRFGLRISPGLWLGSDRAWNAAQIEIAVRMVRDDSDVIDRLFVGNETLLRNELTADELAAYIREVREAIKDPRIEITTGETWSTWLANPQLAAACDVVAVHLLPYWDGVPVEEGVDVLEERYAQVQAAFPHKKVVIAEVGWPSRGDRRDGAVPSLAGETLFIQEFLARARTRSFDYYLLEAFDQPWKIGWEGSVGDSWGLLGPEGQWKFDILAPPASGSAR